MSPVISMMTDFGVDDPFVGIMKGVILSINPRVRLVDLSHQAGGKCLLEASFLLASAYKYFPEGTIHLVVIDPGVGSKRRPILVQTTQFFFVAPDNGVLSYIYQEQPSAKVFHLTQNQYFRAQISRTFHGRDIFAPVAAWLSTGLLPQVFGPEIQDYVKLEIPQPRALAPHIFEFQIIHIDQFGNLITSIREDFFQRALSKSPKKRFTLEFSSQIITHLQTHYAAPDRACPSGALFGSTNNLEIFANQARADQLLNGQVGDTGIINFG